MSLTRDIVLAEYFESLAHQHRGRAFGIVYVQSDRGEATWPDEQGISEMDIDLCHDQCGKQFHQLCGHFSNFYDYHFTNAERHVFVPEQFLHARWIACDNPGDGRISRFGYAERHGVSALGAEQFH